MSINNELQRIEKELKAIKESEDKIKNYASQLNKLNPLKIGQDLIVNASSHQGKTLRAERVFVSDYKGANIEFTGGKPVYFSAVGKVKKVNGELGIYDGAHNILLSSFSD